ncbi:methyltransferase domain-containing protein [Chitinibacter bivalviorum]|uniref:Methyltransferase domain-containing protein n=1 Tax=Chitinibacter bivalviorum TaxID=2739434 RepID=A0A7H9BKU7_9NEIS|nr:methyltransferase domain-containing protein [Chitinibacter bivalviorum]QLG88631.1 methyltransferase domain-containing protein [Chitinibacter bivalviorum]
MNAAVDHFAAWLATPLGQYLRDSEAAWFDAKVCDIFGYKAMQLELPQLDCLRANRMPWRAFAGQAAGTQIKCMPEALPFSEQSLDLLVLPHTLDFAGDPHAVLREAERVLMPEGRLLITGFNPWSLWGLRRLKADEVPWQSHFVAPHRLKDWLALLDLQLLNGAFLCYRPPLQRKGWLDKSRFLERAGDKFWPAGGGVYCVEVVKRVRGMNVIEPDWHHIAIPARSAAAAVEKIRLQAEKDRCK